MFRQNVRKFHDNTLCAYRRKVCINGNAVIAFLMLHAGS